MIQARCSKCRKKIEYGDGMCDKCTKAYREKYRKNNKSKDTDHLIKGSVWRAVRLHVIKRDRGCCRLCLLDNYINIKKLEVHHITKRCDNLELIYEPTNLVTVCRSCHEKLEKLTPIQQKELLGDLNIYDEFSL